jgi:hypothetical protein
MSGVWVEMYHGVLGDLRGRLAACAPPLCMDPESIHLALAVTSSECLPRRPLSEANV